MVRRAAIIGVLPLAAAALLLGAPTASASASSSSGGDDPAATSLRGESVTLQAGTGSGCETGSSAHTEQLSGHAVGPFNGPVDATATTKLSDSTRSTVVTFSIGSRVTGTQTSTAPVDDRGPCVGLTGDFDYRALIGTTPDRGTATVSSGTGGDTVITFTSSQPAPTPAASAATSPSTPSPSPTLGPDPGTPAPPATEPSEQVGEQSADPAAGEQAPTSSPPTTATTPTQPLTFSYSARPDGVGGHVGSCQVDVSPADNTADSEADDSVSTPHQILCTDITGYRATHLRDDGHHVRLTGHARVDGTLTTYRIDVTDHTPDDRPDVFRISTGTGFIGGGELTSGNLTVR